MSINFDVKYNIGTINNIYEELDNTDLIQELKDDQEENLYTLERDYYSVKKLVDYYYSQWNRESKIFTKLVFDPVRFFETLKLCIDKTILKIPLVKTKGVHGYIEKLDVPSNTNIFVRADIHGDLKSLIDNLKNLQSQGFLNQDFTCKDNVHLVFLGDYVDRGYYGLQTLELLAFLKIENFDNIHIIKGNHEDLSINVQWGDDLLISFIDNSDEEKSNYTLLSRFYKTMPLAIYIGQHCDGPKEYVQFTHGLFEIDVDIQPMIDSDLPIDYMTIPKVRTNTISNRISNIRLNNFSIKTDINILLNALQKCCDKTRRKQIELIISAKRINYLATNLTNNFTLTAYNWGDMGEKTVIGETARGLYNTVLNINDVVHYLRLSGIKNKVGAIFRGHQHVHQEYTDEQKNVIVTTLTAGENIVNFKALIRGTGMCYMLTTNSTLKSWKKQMFTHNIDEEYKYSTVIGLYESIYSVKKE